MERCENLSRRKIQKMNPARAQKLNPYIVQDYFSRLETILENRGLRYSPEKMYRLSLHN